MKSLAVREIPYDYEYDEVTCYEHPMMAVMEYYEQGAGRYYALLSKYYGTYYSGNVRKQVMNELEDILGFEVQEPVRLNYKNIRKSIDEGIPVIVGVNLKEIFYSRYYMKNDWVHWMLVKGYHDREKVITLLDNTQYESVGHSYGEFQLPFKLLYQANRSYKKRYGGEYAILLVRDRKNKSLGEVFQHIVEQYMSLNLEDTKNYRQISLMKLYKTEKAKGMLGKDYLLEFKKKLININKYRKLFFDEIKNEMILCCYPEKETENYDLETKELNRRWQKYILKALVKLNIGTEIELTPDEEIIHLECIVQEKTGAFLEYIRTKGVETVQQEKASGYRMENNEDHIVKMTENRGKEEILFQFTGRRIYNWWDMDDAPKVVFERPDREQEPPFFFETVMQSSMETVENEKLCWEAGIFVRNRETGESFLLGIENEHYVVADEIGFAGHKFDIEKQKEYHLFLKIEKEEIEFGLYEGEQKKVLWVQERTEEIDIGIACKTWGKPGRVEVKFSNFHMEQNGGNEHVESETV